MGRYCESLGETIKGQWLKFGPEYQLRFGQPVSATRDLNRQKVKELTEEDQQISQNEVVENLNTGLASVSKIIAGLG